METSSSAPAQQKGKGIFPQWPWLLGERAQSPVRHFLKNQGLCAVGGVPPLLSHFPSLWTRMDPPPPCPHLVFLLALGSCISTGALVIQ